MLPNGERVGAPLGVYRGLDPDYQDHPDYYAWIGGSFEPFSAEEFAKRYPSREVYADWSERRRRHCSTSGSSCRKITMPIFSRQSSSAGRWSRLESAMLGSMHVAMVCAGAVFVMATGPALAEVSRVVVKESGPLGTFGGRQYTWVTAAMEGTVARDDGTTGRYRVPVSLMYPDRNPNGFGFVDVVNSADFSNYLDENAPFGRKIYYTGMYSIAIIYAGKVSPNLRPMVPYGHRGLGPNTASSKMAWMAGRSSRMPLGSFAMISQPSMPFSMMPYSGPSASSGQRLDGGIGETFPA